MQNLPKRRFHWLLLVAVVTLAVTGAVAMAGFALPSERTIAAGIQIAAKPDKVFPHLSSPRRWMAWHPWGPEFYPEMQHAYSGPEQGVGAVWVFRERWSSGRIELTRVHAPARVSYTSRINNGRYVGDCYFNLEPQSEATYVSWQCTTDAGLNPFKRIAITFFSRRAQAGFERGLDRLKNLVERAAKN